MTDRGTNGNIIFFDNNELINLPNYSILYYTAYK